VASALTHALVLIAVGVTLAVALPAAAQNIYKQQLPDGTVVYADHRIKGAKLLYRVTIPDAQQAADRPAPTRSETDTAALDKRLRERGQALERAQQEIVDAGRALVDAQRQLEAGKDPVAGEVQSLATGGTRLLPAYQERVKKLEDNVAKAQARLDRAYSARNQLR
jgi:hypothetical protein